MQRVKIHPFKVGLVFKKGNFQRAITKGNHWLGFGETIVEFDQTQKFSPPCDLDILLQDKILKNTLSIIEVGDAEIVLQYKNGNFQKLLLPGRYAYWKGFGNYDFQKYSTKELEVPISLDKNLFQKSALSSYIRVFVVESYEKGLLFINGQLQKELTAGVYYYWKNDVLAAIKRVDTRIQALEMNGQEILTKDKAALRVNIHAQYQVRDVQKALIENKEFSKQLYVILQLAIRSYVGTLTFDELLDKKDAAKAFIMSLVKEKVKALGLEVLDIGIRDIILPGDMKEIMNQVLMAEKRAQANTITRREETASTRSLLNTAKLMEQNEMLFKLKEMEYVEKIADKINTISLSGGSQIVEQLRQIFVSKG